MIDNHNRYVAFNFNNGWILTRDKIASSWLKGQFNYLYIELYINQYTFEIEHIDRLPHFSATVEDYVDLQKKLSRDWEEFKLGSAEHDFIFFVRNPIHKFMTGWVQDHIIRKLNPGFIDIERYRLTKHFSVAQVDEFLNFSIEEVKRTRHAFPQTDSLPSKFKNIYEEFCFPKEQDFFKVVPKKLIEEARCGHIPENLFLLWKLVFKNPFIYDHTKLHVIDIDLHDIEYALATKFNIPIQDEIDRYSRMKYLKNRSYKYLSTHQLSINTIMETELFFWFEIVSKIYPKSMYDIQPLPKEIKELSQYKKRYFIPEHLDFFDIRTHINWWQYEPEEVSLNYT